MNRPAIEAALAELNTQQSTKPGEARTKVVEATLAKLNELAPANINRTVGELRQFIHSSKECKIAIGIGPNIFNVVVHWI